MKRLRTSRPLLALLALPALLATAGLALGSEPQKTGHTPPAETAQPAPAADGRRGDFFLPADRPDVIVLNAEIDEGTPGQLAEALRQRPMTRIVVLNSPGGSVDSALQMARTIRDKGLNTDIPVGMGCYSACAYMFFAGVDREADGELGVHQIYSDVNDTVLTQTTLSDLLDELYGFGVQQPVISHMLRTPPDDMYVFSTKELRDLGINRGGPIRVAVDLDEPGKTTGPMAAAAYVELAKFTRKDEARRSRDFLAGEWASILSDDQPDVFAEQPRLGETIWLVRVAAASLDRANAICGAIRAAGGGCYVTAGSK